MAVLRIFECMICADIITGKDITFKEAKMVSCWNGHEFCEEHLPITLYEISSVYNTPEEDIRYLIPEEYCPICTYKHVTDTEMINYLLEKVGSTRKEILAEIQRKKNV